MGGDVFGGRPLGGLGHEGVGLGAGVLATDEGRGELLKLPVEQVGVSACGQADDLEAVWESADDIKGLAADGAGGPEDGKTF